MNMSRFILLAGVASLYAAGCSSPAEEGDIGDPPAFPPPGIANQGQGGTGQPVGAAGTGAAPVATAGTGSAPVASAGAGGAPVAAGGAGGTGAGGAAGVIPSGTGNLIMHDAEGWVAGATNGLGIQGSFYTISDTTETPPGVTQIALDDFATSPTTVCASGVASQVLMDAYGQYWGGGVGFNLADPGNMTAPGPWARNTVTGFSFTITGPMIPAGEQLRFKITTFEGGVVNNAGYCTTAAAGPNTKTFGQLVAECWTGGTNLAAPAATAGIVSLQWQVATVTTASTPFDFCIENLTAISTP
jgi:hypothetical protein